MSDLSFEATAQKKTKLWFVRERGREKEYMEKKKILKDERE